MKRTFLLSAIALVASVSLGFAQGVPASITDDEPNLRAPAAPAAAPRIPVASAPAAPAATEANCRDVSVRVPSLKKPANIWLTVLHDSDNALLAAIKACNDSTEAKKAPGSKTDRTVVLRVSQGVNSWASFSVPVKGGDKLMFNYTHCEGGKQVAQWTTPEPLGTRTRVILDKPANPIPAACS
ncbi:MAG: hypothetical protein AAB790_03000 [Patescibacteria group bacterium]